MQHWISTLLHGVYVPPLVHGYRRRSLHEAIAAIVQNIYVIFLRFLASSNCQLWPFKVKITPQAMTVRILVFFYSYSFWSFAYSPITFSPPSPSFCLISMYCNLSCFLAGICVLYHTLWTIYNISGTILHISGLYSLHCIFWHRNLV